MEAETQTVIFRCRVHYTVSRYVEAELIAVHSRVLVDLMADSDGYKQIWVLL